MNKKSWKGTISYGWNEAGVFGVLAAIWVICSPQVRSGAAATAKNRLQWCVATRRNRGYWEWVGEAKRHHLLIPGGPTLMQYKSRFHWVPAR